MVAPALLEQPAPPAERGIPRSTLLAVLVAALGYLVDIYDLILFSVVRAPSLARDRSRPPTSSATPACCCSTCRWQAC